MSPSFQRCVRRCGSAGASAATSADPAAGAPRPARATYAWTRARWGRHSSKSSASSSSSIRRPSQRPADVLGDVVVAEADRVGVAEGPLADLGAGPHADAGQRAQLAVGTSAGSQRSVEGVGHPCGLDQRAGARGVDVHAQPLPGRDAPQRLGGRLDPDLAGPARPRRPLAVEVHQRAGTPRRPPCRSPSARRSRPPAPRPTGRCVRTSSVGGAGAPRREPGAAARSRSGRRGRPGGPAPTTGPSRRLGPTPRPPPRPAGAGPGPSASPGPRECGCPANDERRGPRPRGGRSGHPRRGAAARGRCPCRAAFRSAPPNDCAGCRPALRRGGRWRRGSAG